MSKIQHLYEILQSNPMKRKILLAPSHAQGHQWLEQVSRQYGAVLNTEVHTMESWLLQRCKLLLAKQKLRYISGSESRWIVCRLLQEMSDAGASYLNGITLTPGLTSAFHQALSELREAGINSGDLDAKQFEQEQKGMFVIKLLAQYEEQLKQNHSVDFAGLLPVAVQLSKAEDSRGQAKPGLRKRELIIVDEESVQSAVSRKLLHAVIGDGFVMLSAGFGFTEKSSDFPAEGAQFFHAAGPIAEAREVMRRIAEGNIGWDQVEIVASDSNKTAAAIYMVMSAAKIEGTFAEGLPIGVTNAGKAALLYLDWLETGFHVDPILSALRQGVIRFRAEEAEQQYGEVPASRLIRELERSGIGWGRERYGLLEKMANEIMCETSVDSKSESGNGSDASREKIGALRLLQHMFQQLFKPLSEQTLNSPQMLVQVLTDFVEGNAVSKEESDYQVIHRIQGLKRSISEAGHFAMNRGLALRYVREAVEGIRVQTASTPSPARIHVTSLASGGQTGRPYTFITGMTEKNWVSAFRQDPVLLDEERARIHPDLLSSAKLASRRLETRNRRIGMIRGQCTMSYCSHDISDGQEHMPAYEMLQVLRMQTGQPDADYEALHSRMGEAVRYFRSGKSARVSLDAAEAWMKALLSEQSRIQSGERFIRAAYPFLEEGAIAAISRLEMQLTPYDGLIDPGQFPVLLSGGEGASAFSASKLELYGRCPLQYFYQEILGVRVKEIAVYDRTKWLDALQRGSLLHLIFNRYLTDLKERCIQGNQSAIKHDRNLLHEVTEQVIEQFAKEVPAPSEHIFRKEAESIRKDVGVFYSSEQVRTTLPVFTELQLHEEETAFKLELSDELAMPIRGYVDRVDEIEPHVYKIIDYKTGNPRKYKQNECFSGGTQIQLALYGMAVEQWMKEKGIDEQAQVAESSYVFPTERGMGEEVSRPQNRRKELLSLIDAMQSSMQQGLFPPTDDPNNCKWCDYSAVCGSHAKQFAEKRNLPENAERLGRLLEVNRFA